MHKIFKRIIFTLSIIGVFALLLIPNLKKTIKADAPNIRYISTAIGENETTVGVNYHVNVSKSYIMLSKYSSFPKGFQLIYPEEHEFSDAGTTGDTSTGYTNRYVCRAYLTDLDPNSKYYYKIVAGEEESAVHSFKTYSSNGDTCNILFTTDLHASGGYDTSARGNTSISNIIKNKNVDLAVITGDLVDRGGYESEWIAYFNGFKVFKDMIQASIPGNHEYYHSKSGEYINPKFYNEFFANPQNGPEVRMNSTYAFSYGDALFIMIDTIKQELLKEQKAWFRSVMEKNTKKWVIVGTHAGCISAGAYASDARWMATYWLPLFEEYQVDLALSGHEHIYIRNDLAYKGNKNNDLGVTYLVGCAGTHKQYSVGSQGANYVVQSINYSSNIISITPNKLTCTLYNEKGEQAGQSFSIEPKRQSVKSMTDQQMLDSLTAKYNKEENEIDLSWSGNLFGNVKSIAVNEILPKETTITDIKIPSSKITSTKVLNIFTDYNYEFEFVLTKMDDTTISKKFTITNRYEHKLSFELNGGTLDETPTSYFDNGNTKLPTPTKPNEVFDGWYLSPDFSGTKYTKITPDLTGDLKFYAKYKSNHKLTFNTNCDLKIDDASILEGEEYSLPRLESDDTKVFLGWHLKNDFSDQTISSITMGSEDMNVYAEWEWIEIPMPDEQPKKKCGKKAMEILELMAMTSLLFFVIKKKK